MVEQLSGDLRHAFPDMKGFSGRNLKYMRAFAQAWPDGEFVQQAAAQIPWFHNVVLIQRVKDVEARRFYIARAVEHGWSRSILELQIEQGLHERQGTAPSNFQRTLRHEGDRPTLGILLCKSKNNVVVEYALRDMNKPIGVANWETKLVESLPEDLRGTLPSVEALEAELSAADSDNVPMETDEP